VRIEINIADDRPEAKILSAISDPNAFVLDLVRRSGHGPQPGEIPDYRASVDKIRQSPNRFKTREEIDSYISELRAEW
jgi:hypothetical protein